MTLQQFKYVDAIATYGSFTEASKRLLVTQPTLTEAVHALEEELGTLLFVRSSRGATLTPEGEEFLAAARQILSDAAAITARYSGKPVRLPQFAVSGQHYAFVVDAFAKTVSDCKADSYDFTLRETTTPEVIDDVLTAKSEIGIVYLSNRNAKSLDCIFRKEKLVFEELCTSKVFVYLGKDHPLAKETHIREKDLDAYPYITFEQGSNVALYYSEEAIPAIERKRSVRVRDRGTMMNLILRLNGFTVASSGLSKELNGPDIVKVPLDVKDTIRVGMLRRRGKLSNAGKRFAEVLREAAKNY